MIRDAAHMLGIFLISSRDCCFVLFGGIFSESGHWRERDNTPLLTASLRVHPHNERVPPLGSSPFGSFWPATFSFYSGCFELCNHYAASSAGPFS